MVLPVEALAQPTFWISQLVEIAGLTAVGYLAGVLVTRHGIRVNYTRKMVHFTAFFLPVLVTVQFPFQPTGTTTLVSGGILLLLLALLIEPLRSRSFFLMTVFRSFDRPEDRPYTLRWLTTQLAAGYAVIIPFGVLFNRMEMLHLIYIPILISGIGDGLAEPVGVRFGRRRFKVPALFSERQYERSLEGSACVFFTGVAVLLFFRESFTATQLILALAVIPLAMTLTEARAPHTWDQPFLFLTGAAAVLAIVTWG